MEVHRDRQRKRKQKQKTKTDYRHGSSNRLFLFRIKMIHETQ